MFTKYNTIRANTPEWINRIEGYTPLVQWIATEKLHGTNLSFIVTDKDISTANRNGIITDDFYGYEVVRDKYVDKLKLLFNYLKSLSDSITSIQLYGEMTGPGIQKRRPINYGPDKEFYVFDLLINYKDDIQTWANKSDLFMIVSNFGFKHVPVIGFAETSDFLLRLDPEFKSKVNDSIEGDNFAEGFVIEPEIPTFLENGSRVIIKHKAPKYREKTKQRKPKSAVELSEKDTNVFNRMCEYITSARVDNAISKVDIKITDFNKIVNDVYADVCVEFVFNNSTQKLDDPNGVKYLLIKEISVEVRKAWVEIFNLGE